MPTSNNSRCGPRFPIIALPWRPARSPGVDSTGRGQYPQESAPAGIPFGHASRRSVPLYPKGRMRVAVAVASIRSLLISGFRCLTPGPWGARLSAVAAAHSAPLEPEHHPRDRQRFEFPLEVNGPSGPGDRDQRAHATDPLVQVGPHLLGSGQPLLQLLGGLLPDAWVNRRQLCEEQVFQRVRDGVVDPPLLGRQVFYRGLSQRLLSRAAWALVLLFWDRLSLEEGFTASTPLPSSYRLAWHYSSTERFGSRSPSARVFGMKRPHVHS